jgi:hypothetical protein
MLTYIILFYLHIALLSNLLPNDYSCVRIYKTPWLPDYHVVFYPTLKKKKERKKTEEETAGGPTR